MLGKGAHEIKPVTLAEVLKILEKRQGTVGEFGFEQQTTLTYAKKFAHLKHSDAAQMLEELEKMEIKPETAVKIVDMLPANKNLLLLILAKDRAELSEKKMDELGKIIAKYSEKAKKFEPAPEKPNVIEEAKETEAPALPETKEAPSEGEKKQEDAEKKPKKK